MPYVYKIRATKIINFPVTGNDSQVTCSFILNKYEKYLFSDWPITGHIHESKGIGLQTIHIGKKSFLIFILLSYTSRDSINIHAMLTKERMYLLDREQVRLTFSPPTTIFEPWIISDLISSFFYTQRSIRDFLCMQEYLHSLYVCVPFFFLSSRKKTNSYHNILYPVSFSRLIKRKEAL